MGQMRILDGSGDTVVEWIAGDAVSTAEAAELFLALQSERKLAFARPVGASATESTQIKTFDPDAEEIIWVRPIAGG
jgi:hypothetical protein